MKTVTITFPLREQVQVITSVELSLLLSHPSRNAAADFLSSQYALCMDKAHAIINAVRATPPTTTQLFDHKVEVRYPGEERSMEITYAEYNMLPSLTTVQATKFIRGQYQLGLYEAKRCADAARAMHTQKQEPVSAFQHCSTGCCSMERFLLCFERR